MGHTVESGKFLLVESGIQGFEIGDSAQRIRIKSRYSLEPGIQIALTTSPESTGWNPESKTVWNFSLHFQCLPANAVHRQSQFFSFHFSYLIIQNGICMSDARTLGGFSRKTSCLLVVNTKERISSKK